MEFKFMKKILMKDVGHGYACFCNTGKCPVCLTPWPKMSASPIDLEIRKHYPETCKLVLASWGGYIPAGISGQDLWKISKIVEKKIASSL